MSRAQSFFGQQQADQSCGAGPCSGGAAGGGTRTYQQQKGWQSFGVTEKASAFSALAAGPQQLFQPQCLKSYNLTLNYRQSSGELLWLLRAAWRGIHTREQKLHSLCPGPPSMYLTIIYHLIMSLLSNLL